MKIKSIKFRLLISFSALIITVTVITAYLSLATGQKLMSESAQDTVQLLADDGAKLVESRIQTLITELSTLSRLEAVASMQLDVQLPALESQLESSEYVALAIVQPDGTANYTDGTESNLADRDYIQKALEGQSNISDVIISKVTGEPVIMVAVPILSGDKVVGVLIGRKDGNALSVITGDTGYGKKGYGYMINSTGQIIAHPTKELVLKQLNPIKIVNGDAAAVEGMSAEELAKARKDYSSLATAEQYMLEKGNGFQAYQYEGRAMYAGFSKVEETDWTFVVTADRAEVLSAIDTLKIKIGVLAVICLLVGLGIVFFIGTALAGPITGLAKVSHQISNLDITQDVPQRYIRYGDEIGTLAKAMQSITVNLRKIIGEITDSAVQVSATAQQLTATTEQSAVASEEVSRTVEDIAKGATDQASNTENGSAQAIKLGDTIDKNREYLYHMNTASEKITGVVNDGLEEIGRLSEISKESSQATEEIYDIILKTNESTAQIGEASNVIASIAGQTNLLALNASIEAARAGEAGKGFAVVASEIKKLAGQSASSTSYIDQVVKELQEVVARAVSSIERVKEIAGEQSGSVENTKLKYESIMTAVGDSVNAVNLLNVSEDDMLKAKSDIMDMLQTLSAIAQENAASTEEASSAILEQSASMEEIAKSSERLAQLAGGLQEIILRFKI